MKRPLPSSFSPGPRAWASQAGVTLVELLVAIIVMGVGMLALLTLFPLGALEMAQAIKDDRTGAIADNAAALGEAGEALVAKTASFVEDSLAAGAVDPLAAARLRDEYEELALQAADIERQLLELRDVAEPELIQRHVGPLLAQVRSIQRRIYPVTVILKLVERGGHR